MRLAITLSYFADVFSPIPGYYNGHLAYLLTFWMMAGLGCPFSVVYEGVISCSSSWNYVSGHLPTIQALVLEFFDR